MKTDAFIQGFSQKILTWFEHEGRKDLPWQKNINPYRVWVSEIMLQQTQVMTVIPYYERFMQRFPDIKALAKASIDEVLGHWSGLGYYARARNIHKTAQIIDGQNKGRFPTQIEQVMELPGVGRSTAGAILSLANRQYHTILDGNVKRVLARVFMLEGWPGNGKTAQIFWQQAEELTPQENTANYNQAMMDLGATVCMRSNPQCERCPIACLCQAKIAAKQTQYPHKKPSKPKPTKKIQMLMVNSQSQGVLLVKRPPVGIWGGLLSFPELEMQHSVNAWCLDNLGLRPKKPETWPVVRHTFSHFHLEITPVKIELNVPIDNVMEEGRWVWYKDCNWVKNGVSAGGFAAPVSRLLERLKLGAKQPGHVKETE